MAIRGVLLDIDGHLSSGVGGPPIEGAAEAVRALRERFPLRFVTNATSRSRRGLAEALRSAGIEASEEEIVTPTSSASTLLGERGEARGLLLADEGAREDLAWFEEREDPAEARAVLLASECHDLTIRELGPAIAALRAGARLYALQANRVFEKEGALLSDLGPLAAFLAYAADTSFEHFGKPSRLVFESVASSLGLGIDELLMSGDDAEFDVSGALAAGLGAAVLTKTGKYREGDEERYEPRPTAVIDSVAALPEAIGDISS